MYYKMSDSNKTIHSMATANLFLYKQEISCGGGVWRSLTLSVWLP